MGEIAHRLNATAAAPDPQTFSYPSAVKALYAHVVRASARSAARTSFGSEWKYVPVRRLAIFIEECLYRGTRWVLFEPNDERLWAQIRPCVGAFMCNLLRRGFQGSSPPPTRTSSVATGGGYRLTWVGEQLRASGSTFELD
jgi:hypothetical protein